MEETYKITLADGTVIDGLSRNGNNYISNEEIAETLLDGNLSPMTIEGGGETITYEHGELVQQRQFPQIGEGWFLVFRDKPQSEILLETITQNAGDITDIQEALADLATLLTEA